MTRQALGSCIAMAAVALIAAGDLRAQTPSGQGQRAESQQPMMKGMTEAEFVPMMIKHHQDGIAMARHEEQNGSSAEVKALAAKIRQSQERELAELKSHGEHAGGTKGTSGHADHDKMMEQHSQATMKRLKSASGQALDHAFLEEMAKHHEQAIGMAESAKIQNAQLKQLVQKMISGQRQELSELKKQQASHK